MLDTRAIKSNQNARHVGIYDAVASSYSNPMRWLGSSPSIITSTKFDLLKCYSERCPFLLVFHYVDFIKGVQRRRCGVAVAGPYTWVTWSGTGSSCPSSRRAPWSRGRPLHHLYISSLTFSRLSPFVPEHIEFIPIQNVFLFSFASSRLSQKPLKLSHFIAQRWSPSELKLS